jgi:PhzF family phenazine biosynthesis protein
VQRRFQQVDVFTTVAYAGNPVAVVLDAEGLNDDEMRRFARWTNLSETTFVLPPDAAKADYRLRIFTPDRELPFAGHPTLGSCHAWLSTQPGPAGAATVIQECAAGLVAIRHTPNGLAFSAPPLLRSGPVAASVAAEVAAQLGVDVADMVEVQWVDNGPGWLAVLLESADAVKALRPGSVDREIGVLGPYPPGSDCAFEVRAFVAFNGSTVEDPVTGSLNASLGQWLLSSGRASGPYVVSQGTMLQRAGRVHVSSDADGSVWVGGGTLTCISGHVEL